MNAPGVHSPHPSTPLPVAPPVSRPSWPRRLGSAAGGWLLALLLVIGPLIVANILTRLFLGGPGLRDVANTFKALVLVASYWGYVRWRERRPVRELSLAGAAPEVLAGLLLGGLLLSAAVAVLAVLGVYTLDEVGPASRFGAAVVTMLPKIAMGALVEEIVFRLLLQGRLERSLGPAWALAVSSLIFGLAHLGNPGATPAIAIALGAELGLLLGAAYRLTGRIWLCFGLHLAWNFAQGAVYSLPVSGLTGEGWLRGHLAGPAWLTGGTFGVEGSAVALVLGLAAAAALLALARRRGRLAQLATA